LSAPLPGKMSSIKFLTDFVSGNSVSRETLVPLGLDACCFLIKNLKC
jgi:hypothetical protein